MRGLYHDFFWLYKGSLRFKKVWRGATRLRDTRHAPVARSASPPAGGQEKHNDHGSDADTDEEVGMPPTGKTFTIPAVQICRFAEGKLVEMWGFCDSGSQLRQLGPAAPAVSTAH